MTALMRTIIYTAFITCFFGSSLAFAADGSLSVRKGIVVNAPAADVWAYLRDYNAMEVWHPAIIDSFMVGDGMTSGSRRVLILSGDGRIVEELTSFSDQKMTYSYEILDSPLPLANYKSSLTVETSRRDSKVIWQSTFDAKDVSDQEAVDFVTGVYNAGLEAIKEHFE